MGVNSVTLVGRAGRDPEVRYFESGSMVANLTIAVNRRSRDDEPDWFNLEIWGKQAQVAADYVKKGSLLGIIGSFKLDRWSDRNSGEERSKPVVRLIDWNSLARSETARTPAAVSEAEVPAKKKCPSEGWPDWVSSPSIGGLTSSPNPKSQPNPSGQNGDHQQHLDHLANRINPDLHVVVTLAKNHAGDSQQQGPDQTAGGGPDQERRHRHQLDTSWH